MISVSEILFCLFEPQISKRITEHLAVVSLGSAQNTKTPETQPQVCFRTSDCGQMPSPPLYSFLGCITNNHKHGGLI